MSIGAGQVFFLASGF